MNYAIVSRGAVVNVIVGPLPDAADGVTIGDIPAGIGDTYADGLFIRNGATLLSPLEEAHAAIAKLDETVVDLAYQNALLTLGITQEE